MKRPIGHSVIAAFAIIFAFAALIATINTGDLFVRGFLIIAAITATIAAQAVWSGRRGAAKRVALWSIATAVLASAVFIYSRYYTLRQADESIASSAIAAALIISFCALYLERRPWARSVGAERGRGAWAPTLDAGQNALLVVLAPKPAIRPVPRRVLP